MRKQLTVIVLAVGGLGFSVVPATAASTDNISGMFTVHFPKAGQQNNVYPCPTDVFCGVGSLQGFGQAEFDVFDSNFQPVPGTNCLSFDKMDDITLLGSTSTLALVGSGTLCFPGNSGNVPPSPSNQDYGHPGFWTTLLTVDGSASTGVFSGAAGNVTENFTVAGGVGIWRVTGTITRL